MNIGIIGFVYLDRTFMFFRRFNVYKKKFDYFVFFVVKY